MRRIVVLIARRDRVMLPVWVVTTGLLAFAAAGGVQSQYADDAARAGILKLAVATPSIIALRGIPDGASLGSFVYFQVFTYLAIMAALMSTFFVTRHARADEERGRSELVAATSLARWVPLAMTIAVGIGANAAIAIAIALGLMGGGIEAGNAFIAGLATGAVGSTFVAIAAVVSQLMPTSRSANGTSAAVVGVAFALRAIGDASGTPRDDLLSITPTAASWLSPIGWGQQVFALTNPNLAPLVLCLALTLAASAVALVAQSRRDLGSSVIAERSGRARARRGFSTPLALAWRQHAPSLVGWTIGGALLGALAGSLAPRIIDSGALDDSLTAVLEKFVPGGSGQLLDLLVAAIIGIAGVLAAGAGVQAVLRARDEEADGRIELVLAAPVSRVRWLASYLVVAVASVAIVALAAGLAAGASLASEDPARVWSSLAAGMAQLPAALAFVGAAVLVLATAPRATVPAGWCILALGFLLGQFGELLGFPDWLRNASPFTHTPALPATDVDWSGAVAVLGATAVIVVAAFSLVRSRQLTI